VTWRRESVTVVSYPAGLSAPAEGPRTGPYCWCCSVDLQQDPAPSHVSDLQGSPQSSEQIQPGGRNDGKRSYLGAAQIFPNSLDSPLTHLLFPASWSILQTKHNSARYLWTSWQTGFAATCNLVITTIHRADH